MSEVRKPSDFSIARILASDRSAYLPRHDKEQKCSDTVVADSRKSGTSENTSFAGHSTDSRRALDRGKLPLRDESDGRSRSAGTAQAAEKHEQTGNGASNELAWLRCTRYKPPRLPRKSSAAKSSAKKRRPGAHPRIPFSALQLDVLEDKYAKGAYLSRRDVVHLSALLRLPQSRVKIWFQNRRARERRELQTYDGIR